MLAEHGVDNANEGLVAIEKPVPSGAAVALQPTFALVFAEHRVEDAALRREELVIADLLRIPLAIGDFKDRLQEIGDCLIGPEDTEIAFVLVQFGNVAQEEPRTQRVLRPPPPQEKSP